MPSDKLLPEALDVVNCYCLSSMIGHPITYNTVIICLQGSKIVRSSGWSLWEVCGGRVSTMIPLALEKAITSILTWISYLLKITSCLCSRLQFVCFWQCCRYYKKFCLVIQPDGWEASSKPGGAACSMRVCQFTVHSRKYENRRNMISASSDCTANS